MSTALARRPSGTGRAFIRFSCPACSRSVKVPPQAAGKKGRCPGCKGLVDVPDPDRPPAPRHGARQQLEPPPVREVDWNALPAATRDALAGAFEGSGSVRPALESREGIAGAVGWGFLALCGLAGLAWLAGDDLGALRGGLQGAWAWAGYAALLALVLLSVVFAVHRVLVVRALPFTPGWYLLPTDLIDATGPRLRVIPLASLRGIDVTDHHANGTYTRTEVLLDFASGLRHTFVVSPALKARDALRRLEGLRQAIGLAAERRDLATLSALDPFLAVRMEDGWERLVDEGPDEAPRARPVHPFFRDPGRAARLALAAAALLSGPALLLRNALSDEAMLRNAQAQGSTGALRAYIQAGGRRADEVRAVHLPTAALREAERAGSVTALRQFLGEYPDSCVEGQARAALHARYQAALAQFRAQASQTDPRLLPFMEALIGFQERTGVTALELRFTSPGTAKLEEIDRELRDMASRNGLLRVAPIARHFQGDEAEAREGALLSSLQEAFRRTFPADVLALQGASGPGAGDVASVEVRYEVAPSGMLYTSDRDPSQGFVGITVGFQVRMSVPGASESLDFALAVEPPQQFEVRYQSAHLSYAPRAVGAPDAGLVYQVMALRAFDQLAGELRGVFFRPQGS